MKHFDIYCWSYKDPKDHNSNNYWCTTQIGVVIDDKLVDTYWGWPPERYFSDGRKWSLKDAEDKLNLEFIANLDDLVLLTDTKEFYDDVIDLTHSNSTQNLRFIRKGQERSIPAMIKHHEQKIQELQSDIKFKQYKLNEVQEHLLNLLNGTVRVYS